MLDAGVHVPVAPGGFAALFARRAREHASLARLLVEESLPHVGREGGKEEDEKDENGSATLNPASQTLLATMCVSGAFAKLAPILCFAAPFVRRGLRNVR